jgi:hypothetical protein
VDQRNFGCPQEILNASLTNGCLSCTELEKGCGSQVEEPVKAVEVVSL